MRQVFGKLAFIHIAIGIDHAAFAIGRGRIQRAGKTVAIGVENFALCAIASAKIGADAFAIGHQQFALAGVGQVAHFAFEHHAAGVTHLHDANRLQILELARHALAAVITELALHKLPFGKTAFVAVAIGAEHAFAVVFAVDKLAFVGFAILARVAARSVQITVFELALVHAISETELALPFEPALVESAFVAAHGVPDQAALAFELAVLQAAVVAAAVGQDQGRRGLSRHCCTSQRKGQTASAPQRTQRKAGGADRHGEQGKSSGIAMHFATNAWACRASVGAR